MLINSSAPADLAHEGGELLVNGFEEKGLLPELLLDISRREDILKIHEILLADQPLL